MAIGPALFGQLVLSVGTILVLLILGSVLSMKMVRRPDLRRRVLEINLYLWTMIVGIIAASMLVAVGALSKQAFCQFAWMLTGAAIGASTVTCVRGLWTGDRSGPEADASGR